MKHWTSTFEDAEERLLDIALAATPQQRLEWLEEAQQFALECGLPSSHSVGWPAEYGGRSLSVTESKPESDARRAERSKSGAG
jgi:hypothetical protein